MAMSLRGPDGFILRVVKALALPGFFVTLAIRRLVAGFRQPKRWVLGGDCRRCSACCESPSLQVDRLTWHLPLLRRTYLWWQSTVNGFDLVTTERPRIFVFRCAYFDAKARRCTSYSSRPGICRDYPRFLLEQAWPEFLPGCGYRSIAGNAKSMLVALNTSSATQEQKDELKKRLRLE